MRRINVVGTSGSGKSTFARRLARHLAVPYVELDALFWRPGWGESSDEEFFPRLKAALGPEGWVVDGNYTRTIPLKWDQVDAVIWLDFSFPLTLKRAVLRAARRAWSQEELWPGTGNRESWRKLFTRHSIVWWTIKTHAKVRRQYEATMRDPRYGHIRFVRLTSPAEAEAFLTALGA